MSVVGPTPEERIGQIFEGNHAKYRLALVLGKGAYGQTYLAHVESLKPDSTAQVGEVAPLQVSLPVVIKLPPLPDVNIYTDDEQIDFLVRVSTGLMKEYRVLPRLNTTRSAAHVYDYGQTKVEINNGPVLCHFVVFEFVPGKKFNEWRQDLSLPLSAEDFFRWARKLSEALSEIHQAGVVHGDIWPENIMMKPDEARNIVEPVFIDFGQSVFRAEIRLTDNLEKSHRYMAPERENSVAADIYSLCSTLFFLATGQVPPKAVPDKERGKREIVTALRQFSPSLYKENSGIADILARGLRCEGRGRTPDAERLLQDIDLFDPAASSTEEELRGLLDSIGGNLRKLQSEEALYTRMLGMRLRHLDRNIDEMLLGIHDVQGDHEALVMAMAQYLSVCQPDDQYLTASVPWLWHAENMGVNGRLRSMNKEIIKRGTTVRRVFVVTSQETLDPKVREVLLAHAEMLREIDQETDKRVNTTEIEWDRRGVFTGVLVLSEEERQQRFRRNPHSGIWLRGSKAKMILPFYDEETKRMTGVRLRPGNGKPEALRKAFAKDYLDKAKEIRQFLETLGGTD